MNLFRIAYVSVIKFNMIKHKIIMIKLILLISVFDLISSQTQIPCTKEGYKQIDEILTKLSMFGAENRRFPTTNNEMTKFCR